MKKPKLAAVVSAIVWGAGQAYNKQWLKGSFFFLFQVILVGIEILTGVPAGNKGKNGKFPLGTVNYLVSEKLRRYSKQNEKDCKSKEA